MDKIGELLSLCFIKEKYFWKLVCVSCTATLVLELLIKCFLIRPTGSSFEQIQLNPNDVPNMLVCKEIGFEPRQFWKYGYEKVSKYNDGIANTGKFIGWSGLKNIDSLR